MENSSTQSSSKRDFLSNPRTRSQYKNMKRENPIFPEDIIFEILVRLPVKTLVRFMCVSKSWLSLISTPQFIKTHLGISSSFSNNLRVMVKAWERRYCLKQFSALSLTCEPLSDALDVDSFQNLCPDAKLQSSCNGLVCISRARDVFLLNPSTRMSHTLPPVKPSIYNVYGLGYDESSDDYKVLAIIWDVFPVVRRVVKLYSLRTNSWKRIEDFKAGVTVPVMGSYSKFLAGKIHLLMEPAWDIVSFDLKTEVYGTVKQPNYAEHATRATLTGLGGSLCVVRQCAETRVDLWVLKEYGVKESWTKLVSISYPFPSLCCHPMPVCILPNGKILLAFEYHFVVYDLKDNSLRRSETSYPGDFIQQLTFIESLVSPTAYPDPGLIRQRRCKKYYPVRNIKSTGWKA